MTIKIKTVIAEGNGGNGVAMFGNPDVEIGVLHAKNNTLDGVYINDLATVCKTLGIPETCDAATIKKILEGILETPQAAQTKEAVEAKIESTGLLAQITGIGADITTIASNFISMANSPQAQAIMLNLDYLS